MLALTKYQISPKRRRTSFYDIKCDAQTSTHQRNRSHLTTRHPDFTKTTAQLYDPTNLFLKSKRSYFKYFELAPEITLIISTYIHCRSQELRLEKRLEEFIC
ncbi:hypothetical protein F511_27949 [Dorcoceras hygrometricum]|uniref:Uncharacterized protein n=1 Tax=Dorcoceras hygrometricum TaxID=472368 RepID=A0A2Z7CCA6_9LAMI|nr:hypothetical protein F511_27949 [Dorcoceras hygrometricum]